MDELKPCPFCGGGADFYIGGSGYIQCTHCLAMIPYRYGLPYADGKQQAIAAWNRRPAPGNKPIDGIELAKIAVALQQLKAENTALKAKFDEVNRYNISCTKEIDRLLAEKVAPENKPLTLEQLRQMDGEPVYIVVDGRPDLNAWHMVRRTDVGIIAIGAAAQTIYNYDGKLNFEGGTYYDIEHGNLYGKTWLAYAHKPEGEATT